MEKNRQDLDHSYPVQIQIQGRFKMGRKVQLMEKIREYISCKY